MPNLTRPHLIAGVLCLLLLLAAAILLSTGRFAPSMMRAPENLRAFDVQSEPAAAVDGDAPAEQAAAAEPGATAE